MLAYQQNPRSTTAPHASEITNAGAVADLERAIEYGSSPTRAHIVLEQAKRRLGDHAGA
jgi:hypothetical protein